MSVTNKLHDILMAALNGQEKRAFVPTPPAGDPAAAGAPPMDPSMMGAPMDPSMMGGAPPMDPSMMGAPPLAPDGLPLPPEPAPEDTSIKDQIKQVLEETGVIKPKKVSPEVNTQWLHSKLDALMQFLNIPIPPAPEGLDMGGKGEKGEGSSPESPKPPAGLSSGSAGQASVADLGSLPPTAVDFGSMGGAPAQGQQKAANSVQRAIERLRTHR